MKYLKTFENFSNVNESNDESDKHKVAYDEAEKKFAAMSEADKAKLKTELENLAKTLGITPEQLVDATLVAKKMEEKGINKKIEAEIPAEVKESLMVNEGLKEMWTKLKEKVKDKFWNILTKIGLGGMIAGLVPVVLGGLAQEGAANIADFTGGTVNPSTGMVIGGIAIAVSFAAMLVGLKKSGAMD
jgi:antitoxin component of RelBE/YafQ-DinJ toxin-antitoxin module